MMERRDFLGKVAACFGMVAGAVAMKVSNGSLPTRGKCNACGSTRLWWADSSDAARRGACIIFHRPLDGAQVKIDLCADCYTMRAVDVTQ